MIEILPFALNDFLISMPGSKSITNRVLLLAALAEGESVLYNVLSSDDADYMKRALIELGVEIEQFENGLRIKGLAGKFIASNKELFLGNAGTATRFLTAALTICDFETRITGNERMQERPIGPLIDALKQLGAEVFAINNNDCPPLSVRGPLKGGNAVVSGSFSSQYFSALLMAAPYAENDVEVTVDGDLVSKPYFDITLRCMEAFGVEVVNEKYRRFFIKSRQGYSSQNFIIEGDASGASYFLGIAALNKVKSTISNVSLDAIQGDVSFLEVLEKMGVDIGGSTSGAQDGGSIWARGSGELNSLGEIDLNHIPDAAMTVAVLASFADGVTEIVNVENLRIKETDRIAALVTELRKIGVDSSELSTGIRVVGKGVGALHGAEIETYDDHRMAMCFAMAGSVVDGIRIKNPDCVTKTYPEFWNDLKKIGVHFSV